MAPISRQAIIRVPLTASHWQKEQSFLKPQLIIIGILALQEHPVGYLCFWTTEVSPTPPALSRTVRGPVPAEAQATGHRGEVNLGGSELGRFGWVGFWRCDTSFK